MSFNFTEVERGKIGGSSIPDDVLRISNKRIAFNESVTKLFSATKMKLPGGTDRIRVSLAYDLYNQAIKATASAEGFTMGVAESGTANGPLPSGFRKAGLPAGDYKLVEGERNIFQLAR